MIDHNKPNRLVAALMLGLSTLALSSNGALSASCLSGGGLNYAANASASSASSFNADPAQFMADNAGTLAQAVEQLARTDTALASEIMKQAGNLSADEKKSIGEGLKQATAACALQDPELAINLMRDIVDAAVPEVSEGFEEAKVKFELPNGTELPEDVADFLQENLDLSAESLATLKDQMKTALAEVEMPAKVKEQIEKAKVEPEAITEVQTDPATSETKTKTEIGDGLSTDDAIAGSVSPSSP